MSKSLVLKSVNKVVEQDGQKHRILSDVSFEAKKGEILAIMGKSGSGKTTLLSIASGIDSPDSGTVTILEKDFYRLRISEQERFRNQNIGILFQNYHLIPELTCEENIRMPLCFSRKKSDDAQIDRFIQVVGLQDKRSLYPSQMSGGEQQRTAILRAVVNDPELIFADEPTGALDSKTGASVIHFLINYAHKLGKTIVLVTHDEDIASQCDKVLVMADGRIMC